jgi:hypothetical protein
MSIITVCPECGSRLKTQEDKAGKVVRCPECDAQVRVAKAQKSDAPILDEAIQTERPREGSKVSEARPARRNADGRSVRRPDRDDDDDYDDGLTTLIPTDNPKALAAYYLGVFSLVPFLGMILGPLAIIFGVKGRRYQQANPRAHGTGHAIAGIVLGSLTTFGHVAGILIIVIGIWSHAAAQPQTPQNPQAENRINDIVNRSKVGDQGPKMKGGQLDEPLFSVNRDLMNPLLPLNVPPEDGLVAAVRVGELGEWRITFSPDGKYLAVGGLLIQTANSQTHTIAGRLLAFSHNAQTYASLSIDANHIDKSLNILPTNGPIASPNPLDANKGKPMATLAKISQWCQWVDADFSPDGRFFAAVIDEVELGENRPVINKLLLWKCGAFGEEPKNLLTSNKYGIVRPIFSRDSLTIAFATDRKEDGIGIQILDIATGQKKAWLKGHKATINSLAYSSDGAILASASHDGTAKLWNTAKSQELLTLTGHRGPILKIVFSPQGEIVATFGSDGTLRLWEVNTGQQVALRRLWEVKTGQQVAMESNVGGALAFSPDGRLVITGTKDLLKAWDVAKLIKR